MNAINDIYEFKWNNYTKFCLITVAVYLINFLGRNRLNNNENPTHKIRESGVNLTISIITFNRLNALMRLMDSLVRANYGDDKVTLYINIEAGAPIDMYTFCNDFFWPYGTKHVRARVVSSGLVAAVVESWYPADDNEFGLLLEDDIEVSPYFYIWLQRAFLQLQSSALLPSVFGISLYTPRVIETTNPYAHYSPDVQLQAYNAQAYLHQLPCSWGALQFPKPWSLFQKYMHHRLSVNSSFMLVSSSRTNGWIASWKKFYIEMAWAKGLFMLYPNFFNQTSFSTNHLEAGVHIKKHDTIHDQANYTVPLKADLEVSVFWHGGLPALDVFNVEYNLNREEILSVITPLCRNSYTGFTGSKHDTTFEDLKVGNKMESGHQLIAGRQLVSTPVTSGAYVGYFFTLDLHQHGLLAVNMYNHMSVHVKVVFSAGHTRMSVPWLLSMQLNESSLRIAPVHCFQGMFWNESSCAPVWQVNLPRAIQYTLHLSRNGNLMILEGCGCSNQIVWQSFSGIEGIETPAITCLDQQIHRQHALSPGHMLRSSLLNTLLSDIDERGSYVEAVMQADGNFVLYRNPSAVPTPVFSISPTNVCQICKYGFSIQHDGNLQIFAIGKSEAVVVWQNGFHGNQLVPHFLSTGPDGSLNVHEGYSLCDSGRTVWSTMLSADTTAEHPCTKKNENDICRQSSPDVFNFFSDPRKLTVIFSTTGVDERAPLLSSSINHIVQVDVVSCILVVWHKPFQPSPRNSFINGKVIRFLTTSTDSLNNRFYPSIHIATEAVLVLDDDIAIHHDDIRLLLKTWQLFTDKIVGFFPRWYETAGSLDTYLYQSENNNSKGYHIMLTKAMVLSKRYIYEYSCGLGNIFHSIVDSNTNCEDIAMNFLVAFVTGGPSSIYVHPIHLIGNYGKSLSGSLQKRGSHQDVRTRCLQKFETLLDFRLPSQDKAAYGQGHGKNVQVILNESYLGVGHHHVDCSRTRMSDGCIL